MSASVEELPLETEAFLRRSIEASTTAENDVKESDR